MKIKAQVSMVLNLDKCLGCHTCSITCKNTWTNREGAEYMYFNNVETRPGVGYPRHWEDQEKWKGGWTLDNSGKLALSTGSKTNRLMKLFFHPEQPELKDYFEPWTYDYETLIHGGRKNNQPVARPRSLVTKQKMEVTWGPNWDDDLAGGQHARSDVNLAKMGEDIVFDYEEVFCYPRLENGLPQICAETCVGRMRYVGVVFYDMDKVEAMAATKNEQDIYENTLDLILDPHDPEVIKAARAEGISDAWIKAAQKSPVYKLVKEWGVALPLHPEYRTLPMVWYVPPLSPILQRVTSDVYLPDAHEMRVPVQYLANLFTAGNTEILARTLQRVLDMREYMRRRETGDGPIEHKVDLTEDQMYGMYKLLALSKYNDRFVIPSDVKVSREGRLEMQHNRGFACPTGGCQ